MAILLRLCRCQDGASGVATVSIFIRANLSNGLPGWFIFSSKLVYTLGCLENRPPATLTESQPVGPQAFGRPAPTGASAWADARHEAPKEADFNRAASGA